MRSQSQHLPSTLTWTPLCTAGPQYPPTDIILILPTISDHNCGKRHSIDLYDHSLPPGLLVMHEDWTAHSRVPERGRTLGLYTLHQRLRGVDKSHITKYGGDTRPVVIPSGTHVTQSLGAYFKAIPTCFTF
jgi:hypothetical protein